MFIRSNIILLIVASMALSVQAVDDTITHEVTFKINIGDQAIGDVVLGLYGLQNPLTVKNFVAFAGAGHNNLKYQGTSFHRVIQKFMIQGGDMINHDGTGSASIYGSKFADEFPSHLHSVPGVLSMANSGPNTNGCQFFITTVKTSWLDNMHVVFGKVLDKESFEVVQKVESTPTGQGNKPKTPVTIASSSVRELALKERYVSPLKEF